MAGHRRGAEAQAYGANVWQLERHVHGEVGAPHAARGRRGARIPAALLLAAALACGIAAAGGVPRPLTTPAMAWIGAACALAFGILALVATPWVGVRRALLAGAAFAAGVSLGVSASQRGFPAAGPQGVVRLVGRVASAPRQTAGGADELAAHAFGSASVVFELDVEAIERTNPATRQDVDASVAVRVQELGELPPRGARVRVTGWYRPATGARNPGGRGPSGDGSVSVARISQVERVTRPETRWRSACACAPTPRWAQVSRRGPRPAGARWSRR
ncbi:MAG: hypothetical protein JNK53_06080 [Phycisphaerae bacterium]|nr:hypothetical protein [Phycisphaerae bacterium]